MLSIVPEARPNDDLSRLSIRAMVAGAARAARRSLSAYRLPAGHEDARRAPRDLRTALALTEQFCSGASWENDLFARRAALAQVAAENAANAGAAIPKIRANMATMSDQERVVAVWRCGDLGSITDEQCHAAHHVAFAIARLVEAVCLVTLARYARTARRDADAEVYLNRIPDSIAQAFAHVPPDREELRRLRALSAGQEFPQLGDPLPPNGDE